MKIVQINTTCTKGSTGKICMEISKILTENGVENYILHAQDDADYPLGIAYTGRRNIRLQAAKAYLFGNYGFNSVAATRRLIKQLEEIKPDIVHLHNIHSHECHPGILINYLKKEKIKVLWTFHDCWAFTGYCMYFDYSGCDKWKVQCECCPVRRQRSLLFDRSRNLYNRKKELLSGLDLTVVTPSVWLSRLAGESFLKDCAVEVIPNGIDTDTFSPRESEFRVKNNISGYMVLGVSYVWEKRKGIDVFIEMRKRLGSEYTIVLVGADAGSDLPDGIVTVSRTQNQEELAGIYSSADVFFNPTREDNYPTVNMEAVSCGTPVVTFRTGGSGEMLDETCGVTVECNDTDGAVRAIRDICENKLIKRSDCRKKAEEFEKVRCFSEYLTLYNRLLSE